MADASFRDYCSGGAIAPPSVIPPYSSPESREMAKLTLDLDMLQVESFATQEAHGGRGTVEGMQADPPGESLTGPITVTMLLTKMDPCKTYVAACQPTGEQYWSCNFGSLCTTPCGCGHPITGENAPVQP